MAQNADRAFPQWLHYFDTIDSTNNYAMRLIDDGMAQHGSVIWALHQTKGRGQRGKQWENSQDNLMMTLIVRPEIASVHHFYFSMAVATTIVKYLNAVYDRWQVAIKWPNDIYINDKKACGILIENIFRGMQWSYGIIGMGLNVNQDVFPAPLHNATSLRKESGRHYDLLEIITDLRGGILNTLRQLHEPASLPSLRALYNQMLYRGGRETAFRDRTTQEEFSAIVQEVEESGELVLVTPSGNRRYAFGSLEWLL